MATMSIEYSFRCALTNGIHARPASHLEKLCNRFNCEIVWINERNKNRGNAKSVLSLIGTNTLFEDDCRLVITGEDEQQAFKDVSYFIENELEACDSVLETTETEEEASSLPRTLVKANPTYIQGKSVIHGIAKGIIKPLNAVNLDDFKDIDYIVSPVEAEQNKFVSAIDKTIKEIQDKLATCSKTETEILNFQLSFLSDEDFIQKIQTNIKTGDGSVSALMSVINSYREMFRNADSQYLKERELDVIDVASEILSILAPDVSVKNEFKLTEDSICVADNLTPGQFIDMDKKYLKGLVLTHAGATSHTIILARSFGIPTVLGIETSALSSLENKTVILDGDFGIVVYEMNDEVSRYYQQESTVLSLQAIKQNVHSKSAGCTNDGKSFEIAANIASGDEAEKAFAMGADGIGLFRTEMLYMDRPSAPTEEELYQAFCTAVKFADGKPVIIRTMDIGGDKPAEFIKIPKEHNPFLGYRGVRICEEYNQLFQDQLKAILRATPLGKIKIMVPMVSSYEEVLWIKSEVEKAKTTLRDLGLTYSDSYQLGIMIEVPSIMFMIDACCEHLDFLSIGSNDLTQYLIAVDRDNHNVSKYYNCFSPAFIKALKFIADSVHKNGKWIGLCGEMGGMQKALPILTGLGLDEISMSCNAIARTKEELSKLDFNLCSALVDKLCNAKTAEEVEYLLEHEQTQIRNDSIISEDCILYDADFKNKEEALKGIVDKLYLAGRCKNRFKFIDDLWLREEAYTTDIGFGFAIPHSKSEQMLSNTISICKLAEPINWGNSEVSVIVMLALRKESVDAGGNDHMKIFSKLAKKIMNKDFRNQIFDSNSTSQIHDIFNEHLA